MDVHSPKNGIFIGIDPYPYMILTMEKYLWNIYWTQEFHNCETC